MTGRRFPLPWVVVELEGVGFKVTDAAGGAIAYVYTQDDPASRANGNAMSEGQAHKLASMIADQLPGILKSAE